ncbi:restriction endonuclease subunit S [Desulfosudis oleivorans]|uniref:Restriction modification system DNA specificity domain n=1 Tax=Desulfosudis oleivorans (strain DSM 6200 / JCM 39069 / Hxd3) TaxID=96561 RepID=A8ZTW4_DESOH|nr:restriction endonuclease subunit S [Desulfosudis oleivorans]ABW67897.1 restriction modification system DNA specificity domain [Desulfosudis oleivorans Hxd3]
MKELLPEGWVAAPLQKISQIVYGKGLPKNKFNKQGLYPVFGANSIIGYYDSFLYEDPQVLISCRGANSGTINISPPKCFVTSNSLVVQLPNTLHQSFKYLYYALESSDKEKIVTGTAQPQVTIDNLKSFCVPLPPFNEQKRIVARLDQIIPRIDKLKTRLDKIPTIIKRFRQSVLTAAVTGRLTEKWREDHPDVEGAEATVQSIYYRRLDESQTNQQKNKIEKLFAEVETEDNGLLPETWKYTFLNKICESFQYGTSSKSSKKGDIPVLRMGNLQNGAIDWSNLVYSSNKKEIEKYKLEKNTVLFNRTNSPELVGKTAIYLGERAAIFAGYLIRINNMDILDSHYLNYSLNTDYAKAFCNREKTDGVNQSNINAQKLGRFEIPFPPLEEQKEIVRQVERSFALADKLEAHYQNARARVDKLARSVLAKAFRGELTPQDPNDEPAEKLLERILAEKEKMAAAVKKTRKQAKRKSRTTT